MGYLEKKKKESQGLLAFGLDIAEALVVLTHSREKHQKNLGKIPDSFSSPVEN